MKRGLFFGSFDPIHIGHISIVSGVLNANYVDKVIVVPAWHNPFKEHNPAPFMKRWEMCYQSIKNIENASCSQMEAILHDRLHEDKIPTWRVIEAFKKEEFLAKDNIYIITTSETFNEIPKWESGQSILETNNFIIIHSKTPLDWKIENSPSKYGNSVMHLEITHGYIDVCSTDIRRCIAENGIVAPYVTPEVELIIKKNNLYK